MNIKSLNLKNKLIDDNTGQYYYDLTAPSFIYDSDLEGTKSDSVHTLDAPFKERLHKELESKNKSFTILISINEFLSSFYSGKAPEL